MLFSIYASIVTVIQFDDSEDALLVIVKRHVFYEKYELID